MTLSIREQILSAFLTKLSAITGIAGLTVERNRAAAVQEFPKLVMRDGGHEVTEENTGMMHYRMMVDEEGYVLSSADSNLGADINALYSATLTAALADRTLGDLAGDLTETSMDIELDRLEGNAPCAAFNLGFAIDFYTTPGNPTSLAP